MKIKKKLLLILLALYGINTAAQVKIGDNPATIGNSSMLELESPNKAFVLPNVTNTAAIISPIEGMMVYDRSTNCVKAYQNGAWTNCITSGRINNNNSVTANCDANGFTSSSFIKGAPLTGASFSVTITNNTLTTSTIPILASDVVLTGIPGLTVGEPTSSALTSATDGTIIPAGQSAIITYPITGTPATTGTLTASWKKLSLSCTKTKAVLNLSDAITANYCSNAALNGSYVSNVALSNNRFTVTITNNSANTIDLPQTDFSDLVLSGVAGLEVDEIEIIEGGLANGASKTFTYFITGTPANAGTLTATWKYGGLTCTTTKEVISIASALNDTAYANTTTLNGTFNTNVALNSANTFTVTIKNNGSSAANGLPAPAVGNLILTGAGTAGISVASVTPSGTYNLAVGATRTFTYTLSGTPTGAGSLTATWNYFNLTASKGVNVQNLTSGGTAIIASRNCNTISAGTLNFGTPASGATQTITVNVTQTGTYSISTGAVNGVTFSASGNFTATGSQTVVLVATGTPLATGSYTYTLNITPNCSFGRTVVNNASTNGSAIMASVTCNTASAGILTSGVPVSGVTQTITVNVTQTGTYSISTNTVNGVTFSASGNFAATGNQAVVLTATGIPTATGTTTYILNTTPNCNFIRPVANNATTNGSAVITALNCNAAPAGALTSGIPASGVTQTVGVTVTQVGTYNISTNTVNGVTFAGSGNFTTLGGQVIVLTATGIPTATGVTTYVFNTTPNCSFNRTVANNPTTNGSAAIAALNCNATQSGILTAGKAVSGVTQTYTLNVVQTGTYNISTGAVNGVTFSASGTFNTTGTQTMVLTASGTPIAVGSNTYYFNTGSCSFNRVTENNATSGGTSEISLVNCNTAPVGGLVVGQAATGVTQTITVNVLQTGTYNLRTDVINGVTFSAAGTFTTTGFQNVTLTAVGTPSYVNEGMYWYTLNTTPSCNFRRYTGTQPTVTDANGFVYGTIAIGDKIWLRHNLGADYNNPDRPVFGPFKVAPHNRDLYAYGSLIQWGRKLDGHERIFWTSYRTGNPVNGLTTNKSDNPTDGLFIVGGTGDWRVTTDNNLWNGVNAVNNPCPAGFRVPTSVEITIFYGSLENVNKAPHNAVGAALRFGTNGALSDLMGDVSDMWTSTPFGANNAFSRSLFYGGTAATSTQNTKNFGMAVRCIKD